MSRTVSGSARCWQGSACKRCGWPGLGPAQHIVPLRTRGCTRWPAEDQVGARRRQRSLACCSTRARPPQVCTGQTAASYNAPALVCLFVYIIIIVILAKRRDQGMSSSPHPSRPRPLFPRAQPPPIAQVLLCAGLNSNGWLTPSGRKINTAHTLTTCTLLLALRVPFAPNLPHPTHITLAPRHHGRYVQHQRERRPRDAVHQAELHRRR